MLKCQEDSFTTEFTTTLVDSVEDEFLVTIAPGTQKKLKAVGLILEDTIFFPEGGGQPCDQGLITLEGVQLLVKYVIRWQGRVIHLGEETWDCDTTMLKPGTIVQQSLNWPRRLYHMMQHSGQHLISAMAENLFNVETLSWCLGPKSSYVELGVEQLSDSQFSTLEKEVNNCIQNGLPVSVEVFSQNDPALTNAKTRGLPEGYVGEVRVIVIEGVDRNMCCGTHVSNLRQLEMIKLLKTEKKGSKKKRACLLHFVVGRELIFNKFDEMLKREDLISSNLNKLPEEHVKSIMDLKEAYKKSLKKIKAMQEEIAMAKILDFKSKEPVPSLFSFHSPDGDLDFLNFIARQFKDTDITLFLTIGEGEEGNLMLVGPKDVIAKVGPEVCSALLGKGQMTGNRFQAKVVHLGARKTAEDLLISVLQPQSRETI